MARPALIDRSRILDAALALADADGLAAITMLAVAKRLGVTPMALYRHVADKDDLLDALVERLLGEVAPPPRDLPWQERLAAMGRAVRDVGRRHPNVFPLLLQRPAVTDPARAAREEVLVALVDAGATPATAARLERVVASAILGFAASEATGRFRQHSQPTVDGDYEMLERMISAGIAAEVTATVEPGKVRRSPRR